MTALHPDVAPPLRGTFAGLADPHVVDHLVRLGVTAIELLPVHAFFDDRHLVQQGLRNYWGYNTTGFFAPAPRYLLQGAGPGEFRLLVQTLHDAGLEVSLEVVYNHTSEANYTWQTQCFHVVDTARSFHLSRSHSYQLLESYLA